MFMVSTKAQTTARLIKEPLEMSETPKKALYNMFVVAELFKKYHQRLKKDNFYSYKRFFDSWCRRRVGLPSGP